MLKDITTLAVLLQKLYISSRFTRHFDSASTTRTPGRNASISKFTRLTLVWKRSTLQFQISSRQRRKRRGSAISYSLTRIYGVHTPGVMCIQAPTMATCTQMLTERACPEINLALGDIAPRTTRGGSFARSMDHRSLLRASGWVQPAAMPLARATRFCTRTLATFPLVYLCTRRRYSCIYSVSRNVSAHEKTKSTD